MQIKKKKALYFVGADLKNTISAFCSGKILAAIIF